MEQPSTEFSKNSDVSDVSDVNVVMDSLKVHGNSISKLSSQFDVSYAELLKHIQIDSIEISNIVTVITKSVEIVEHFTNKNGLEKKGMVLKLVKRTIKEFVDEEMKASLIEFVDVVGPSFIDTLIFVSKGKLNVNIKKGWKMTTKLLSKCCK